jgi:hypothetical protein
VSPLDPSPSLLKSFAKSAVTSTPATPRATPMPSIARPSGVISGQLAGLTSFNPSSDFRRSNRVEGSSSCMAYFLFAIGTYERSVGPV